MTLGGLAARNLMRNRLRSSLTAAGVAVAVVTFLLLRTVLWSWSAGAAYSPKDRIFTRHKVSFIMNMPRHYVDDIRTKVPGLESVTWANWFGGKSPDPKHAHDFFATLACDPEHFFDVWSDFTVPKDQLDAWKSDKQGAIVGAKLAKKFGWKVGDKVTLQSDIFKGDWEFHVSGLYTTNSKSEDPAQFLFHWEYLDDAMSEGHKALVGWITSRSKPGVSAVAASQAIDKLFDDADTQTLSQDEHAFQASFTGMFSAVLKAMNIVSLVILAIMMLILGNTVAMGVRERSHEYGVMRAIGFLPQHLAALVVGESAFMGLVGGLIGLAIALPFVNLLVGGWIEENLGSMGLVVFRIMPDNALIALGIAVALGTFAAIIPAWQTYKLHVVDALRRVA
jgi:putative ABC transport system permease protein